jgi:TonB family protein
MRKSCLIVIGLALCIASAVGADTNAASRSGQVVVDASTRNKSLNDYTLLTRDIIQKAWKRPLDIEVPSALKGRVRIDYCVKRSGEIDSIKLVRGSGVSDMDKALIEAIRAAQPFPPFPDDVQANRILIRANFIVADLPTAPVATVSQPAPADKKLPQADNEPGPPKLIWGQPAGTSTPRNDDQGPADNPPGLPPAPRKYQWGTPN